MLNSFICFVHFAQDIYRIKDEINDQNIFHLYSTAFALKCTKLLAQLDDLIVTELLNEENVTHFYLDSIEFENEKLSKACEELILEKFQQVLEMPATAKYESGKMISGVQFLCRLPIKQILSLLSNDALSVEHEYSLVELVKEYIKLRDDIPEEEVILPPSQRDYWVHLTEEEQKVRQEKWDLEQAELNAEAREANM